MGLLLVILGVLLIALTVYNGIGLILLVLGLVLMFIYPVGPGPYYGRRW